MLLLHFFVSKLVENVYILHGVKPVDRGGQVVATSPHVATEAKYL